MFPFPRQTANNDWQNKLNHYDKNFSQLFQIVPVYPLKWYIFSRNVIHLFIKFFSMYAPLSMSSLASFGMAEGMQKRQVYCDAPIFRLLDGISAYVHDSVSKWLNLHYLHAEKVLLSMDISWQIHLIQPKFSWITWNTCSN